MALFDADGRKIGLGPGDKIIINLGGEQSVMLRKNGVYPIYREGRDDKYQLFHQLPVIERRLDPSGLADLIANSAGLAVAGAPKVMWPLYLYGLEAWKKLRLAGGRLIFSMVNSGWSVALRESTAGKHTPYSYMVGNVDPLLLAWLVADCADVRLGKARHRGSHLIIPLLKK